MALIAVGGGKGGTGRSLVAAGLAVFLAQLGRRVLLVDAHAGGPQHARPFGLRASERVAPEARGFETAVPNVRLLPATGELGALPGVSLRHARELAHAGGAEHTVLDLPSGTSPHTLAPMLDASACVLVTTPEPAAIEATHRWLRHAFARALTRALKGRPTELGALGAAVRERGGPPEPRALAEAVARTGATGAALAWGALARFHALLVVNTSRSRADLELGEALCVLARQQHGVSLEYLGHVEHDDSVGLAARRQRPLLVDAPAGKASRNLERIARRLLSLEALRAERHAALAQAQASATTSDGAALEGPAPPTHYDTLAIDRGASDEEVRRAYRRLRELYGPESLATVGLLEGPALARVLARIEQARDVLLDPAQRRPYDLSIMSADELRASVPTSEPPAKLDEAPSEPLPELTPETEFSGELLRALREARGLELREISARTKITLASLRAIEQEDFSALPAVVYLRGFVAELARVLKLDPEQVTRTYLKRYRRALEGPSR